MYEQNKILKILNEQRKSGQFCDVIIKLNNNFQVWAHFAIIAPQSHFVGNKYFVQEDMQFSIHNPLKIEICNFDCDECLCDVMDFMYCEDVTVFGEHEEHIKHLCKMLSIQELLKVLVKDDPTEQHNSMMPINGLGGVSADNSIILKIENKQLNKRVTAFQYKIQTQPAQSKMHNCYGCSFKCYKPLEMLQHLHVCESTNTKCSLCDIKFNLLAEFKEHLIRHDNMKPFFCNDCNLRFVTKTALNLHTPKHSKETPHMCSYCGKGFKWKHGLNSHMIVHSKDKKLLCDECGYSTQHLKTLRAHQLSHTGDLFRCTAPACVYTSRRKENLKIHIATHKNETPFVCEVCGHKFSQSKNLKRHALVHLSKDLHKCPHCTFTNYRTDKLKEHILRQHTEKPLLLELPEDIQSSLKELDVDDGGILMGEDMRKKKRITTKTGGGKRKKEESCVGSGALKKIRKILPKPIIVVETINKV